MQKKNLVFFIIFLLLFGSALIAVVLDMMGIRNYQPPLIFLCLLGVCIFCVFVNVDALQTGRFLTPIWDQTGESLVGHRHVLRKKNPKKFWQLYYTMAALFIVVLGVMIKMIYDYFLTAEAAP